MLSTPARGILETVEDAVLLPFIRAFAICKMRALRDVLSVMDVSVHDDEPDTYDPEISLDDSHDLLFS